MKCDEAHPLLEVLCDGGLNAKDSALVLDHLRQCSECHHEWEEIEELQLRLHKARLTPPMPPGLLRKIDSAIAQETSSRKRSASTQSTFAAAAAAVVLIAISVFLFNDPRSPVITATRPTAETLIQQLSSNDLEQAEKSALPAKLGYSPVYVNLADWHMDRAAVLSNKRPRIARFDFSKPGAHGQKLTCYQAPQGTIVAHGNQIDMGGKMVTTGSRQGVQYALWSQSGRDYLLVTTLDRSELMDIVRKT